MLSVLLVTLNLAFSSIAPGTAFNKAIVPHSGFFYSENGFTIDSSGTAWLSSQIKNDNKQVFQFFTANQNGSMQVNSDILTEKQKFEDQLKKWIKDYSFYGFKILGTKTFKYSSYKGILVDLVHNAKQKQVRQYLLEGPQKKYVVFTCENSISNFNQTLVDCHKVMTSLKWMASK